MFDAKAKSLIRGGTVPLVLALQVLAFALVRGEGSAFADCAGYFRAAEAYHQVLAETKWDATVQLERRSVIRNSPAAGGDASLPSVVEHEWLEWARYDRFTGAGITEITRTSFRQDGIERVDVPRATLTYRGGRDQTIWSTAQSIPPGTPDQALLEKLQLEDAFFHDPLKLLADGHLSRQAGESRAEALARFRQLHFQSADQPATTRCEVTSGTLPSRRVVKVWSEASPTVTIEHEFEPVGAGWRFVGKFAGDRTSGTYQEHRLEWATFSDQNGNAMELPRRATATFAVNGVASEFAIEVRSIALRNSPWDAGDWKSEVALRTAAMSHDATVGYLGRLEANKVPNAEIVDSGDPVSP